MSSNLFLSENENKRKGLLVSMSVFVIIQKNFTYQHSTNKKVLVLILGLYMLCDDVVKVIIACQDLSR